MEPISKPNIDKIIENVKVALRNGVYTVYEIAQMCANGTNKCIDWVNKAGEAIYEKEIERLKNEGSNDPENEYYSAGRCKNERERLVNEGSNDSTSAYYDAGRCKNERDRINAEEARQLAEGSDDPTSYFYQDGRCAAERARAAEFATWSEKVNSSYKGVRILQEEYEQGEQDISLVLEMTNNRGTSNRVKFPIASQGGAGAMSESQAFELNKSFSSAKIEEYEDCLQLELTRNSSSAAKGVVQINLANEDRAGLISPDEKKKIADSLTMSYVVNDLEETMLAADLYCKDTEILPHMELTENGVTHLFVKVGITYYKYKECTVEGKRAFEYLEEVGRDNLPSSVQGDFDNYKVLKEIDFVNDYDDQVEVSLSFDNGDSDSIFLGQASNSAAGVMSVEDKKRSDAVWASFKDDIKLRDSSKKITLSNMTQGTVVRGCECHLKYLEYFNLKATKNVTIKVEDDFGNYVSQIELTANEERGTTPSQKAMYSGFKFTALNATEFDLTIEIN